MKTCPWDCAFGVPFYQRKKLNQHLLNFSGASFYSIYIYKVSDDNELQLSSVESSALTSYVVTSLQPGTEYRIHVKSVGDEEVESGQSMTVATATGMYGLLSLPSGHEKI